MSIRWRQTYQQELQALNKELANPRKVNREEDTIFPRQAISGIENEMGKLKKSYDFAITFVHPESFKDNETVRSARRLVKLRFRCKNQNCRQFKMRQNKDQKSSQIQRHWTTYNGLVDFKFSFTYDDKSSKPFCRFLYTFRIFSQKCQTCQYWGKSGLIESCFQNLLNLYSLFIQNSLIMVRDGGQFSWRRAEKIGQKLIPLNHTYSRHLSHLCEACMKKECPRFYMEKLEQQPVKEQQKAPKYVAKIEAKIENEEFQEQKAEYIVSPKRKPLRLR